MVENPHFNNEPRLSVRLTRREFLRLAILTTVVAIVETGCNNNCGTLLSCFNLPTLEYPELYTPEFDSVIAPIRRLMQPEMQDFAVKVTKSNKGFSGGTAVHSYNPKEIHIYIPDTTSESLEVGKLIAMHETIHIFDRSNNLEPSKYIKDEMSKRTRRSKYASNEYQILKESSYCNFNTCRRLGHPQDNFLEVFASSLTILRFYPSEFIEKLEKLSNPESKRLLATDAIVCINALKKFSAIPVEYSDLPFDPNLVAYLIQESQPSRP